MLHENKRYMIIWAIAALSVGPKKDLQIDHIDHKQKSFCISKRWSYVWEKLVKELDKCQLLCSICHKKKSKKEGSWKSSFNTPKGLKHGTVWGYRKYKCRCSDCVTAAREYRRIHG